MKKKSVIFMCLAVCAAALIFNSCKKDDPQDANVNIVLDQTNFEKLNYGEPVSITGTATSESSITGMTFTGVKKEGDNYAAAGDAQHYRASGATSENFNMEFIADSKSMTHIEVKANVGSAASKPVYISVGSVEGEAKGSVYFNANAMLRADTMVFNHQNNPDIFPNPNTGAKSNTPSYISIHGVEINGEKKHILSVDEVRSIEGKDVSFIFCNVLQNTENKAFINGQRGYMFGDLTKMGAGTVGRQCDIYEIDGKSIKSENRDVAVLREVPGSWSPKYEEAKYKFVDSLFIALGNEASTEAQKLRAFYLLGKIQERLDNSKIPNYEGELTSLGGKDMLRRLTDAGSGAAESTTMAETFRAGDYFILRSEVKIGEDEYGDGIYDYYYGIMQVTQIFDDSRAFVDVNGKQRLGQEEAKELFMKPLVLNIKTQTKL